MTQSREYLEEFVRQARDRLHPHELKTIHARALPAAGGKARGRDPVADGLESLGLTHATKESIKEMDTEKIAAAAGRLEALTANAAKRKRELDPFLRVAQLLVDELDTREEPGEADRCRSKFARYVTKAMPEGAVPTTGPEGAAVAFVATSPNLLDVARGEPLVGLPGATFVSNYLGRLGLAKSDVLLTHAVPVAAMDAGGRVCQPTDADLQEWDGWVHSEIRRTRPRLVVALGKVAKVLLGDLADFTLPHPNAVRKFGDSGEVARKLRAIGQRIEEMQKAVDEKGDLGAQSEHRDPADVRKGDSSDLVVAISKADGAKQIAYGVVLDPYIVDSQNDWTPPADVESTAHSWLLKSRVIGMEHDGEAQAAPVESWLEPYPTPEDYRKAMAGEPHSAYRRKFGEDIVHSGAWVLGTKMGDGEWARVESGELGAYSIGGTAARIPVDIASMPKVNFIDIGMPEVT